MKSDSKKQKNNEANTLLSTVIVWNSPNKKPLENDIDEITGAVYLCKFKHSSKFYFAVCRFNFNMNEFEDIDTYFHGYGWIKYEFVGWSSFNGC